MKYRKLIFIAASFILFAVFSAGCADSVDINKKLIMTAIALDFKEDEIWYYLEVANIQPGMSQDTNGGAGKKYIIVKGHRRTLSEVRDDLEARMDKPLYLSAVRALLLTEDFAKEYLVEYLYRFRADENYRKKGLTVITRDDPEKLFKSAHESDESFGALAEGIIETMSELGKSFQRTTMRLLENLSSSYTGILIPCMGVYEKEILLAGYSVVKGSAVTGFIPVEESTGTVFLKADKPRFEFIVPYNDAEYTMDVSLKKRKIKASYKDEEISFIIKMDCKAELLYGDKKIPYSLEDAELKEIEDILKGILTEMFTNAITHAQKEYDCDYLQFDDEFRVRYPLEFESMDWQKAFRDVKAEVDVNVELAYQAGLDYGSYRIR